MFSKSAERTNRYMAEPQEEWLEPTKPARDLKKVFLVFGLGTLSWVATYVGMLELIQANMGSLDLTTKVVVGFSVAMLMTMIIWLLDQMFAPHPFAVKVSYVAGYLFLTLISVGFGFGFYWKVLESRSEASRSAESAVSQVQAALLAGSSRLDQLQGTLEQLTLISREKAILERDTGTTCPNSRPGDGPRRRLRDDDAGRFSFASNFVKGRSTKVKSDMQGLNGDLKKITSSDPSTFDKATGTRNKFLQALSRKLELTATSFNAFRTDPQLRQIRSELAERANRSTFPTGRGNGTFSCPDGQLQSALLGVVKAIDQLPELGKPEIATVEGAQAVVEAFRRLTVTGAGLLAFKLPPSADEVRARQTQAIRSVSSNPNNRRLSSANGLGQGGLAQRDYIPLAIAAFVDICLLLVSIGRPMNRLGGLVPKMRAAERGPVYQILSKFDDIHRDPKIREKFEVFRHVVFDFNGDYYVAVPLDAPRNRNPDEVKNLQLEAHLLGNLFASFEKEKIFSRVYNPLLSRKTIQKKLWRQGSKFAASQAFRTYRFRDGAWSDIILGAVMGAARRAASERYLKAEEDGPQLATPEVRSGDDAEQRARDIIASTIGSQTADVKAQLAESPLKDSMLGARRGDRVSGGRVDDDDGARIAAAFGRYAGHVRENEMSAVPHGRPVKLSWPYRKPPTPPGEADVDLLPANSNTTPHSMDQQISALDEGGATADRSAGSAQPVGADEASTDIDNVIMMPRPTAPASDEEARVEPEVPALDSAAPRYTDVLANAMATSNAAPVSGMGDVEDSLNSPAIAIEQTAPPPLPASFIHTLESASNLDEEENVNVRITERTADFQIPMRRPANGHFVEHAREAVQTVIAMEGDGADAPKPLTQTALIDVDDARMAPADYDFMPSDDVEADYADDVYARSVKERSTLLSDDDLEEISRRFAPRRQAE